MGNITTPYFSDSERNYIRDKYWNVGRNLRKNDVDVKSIPGWNNRGGNSIGIMMFWVKQGWRQG